MQIDHLSSDQEHIRVKLQQRKPKSKRETTCYMDLLYDLLYDLVYDFLYVLLYDMLYDLLCDLLYDLL